MLLSRPPASLRRHHLPSHPPLPGRPAPSTLRRRRPRGTSSSSASSSLATASGGSGQAQVAAAAAASVTNSSRQERGAAAGGGADRWLRRGGRGGPRWLQHMYLTRLMDSSPIAVKVYGCCSRGSYC
ncbi:hypothetical protein BDA96_10G353000 [Sorghum bicolor]|uniref:Uncharacterized protein n=1 Tax=Sorghum bicolor TaxID=4558 RepID=A0A921Q741_SORBI|nr:hypothetical protein BDA96_10G353000 [Sorghum bicolor]